MSSTATKTKTKTKTKTICECFHCEKPMTAEEVDAIPATEFEERREVCDKCRWECCRCDVALTGATRRKHPELCYAFLCPECLAKE
jgi:hypothetical protein